MIFKQNSNLNLLNGDAKWRDTLKINDFLVRACFAF